MRAPWLLIVSLTVCATRTHGQGLARPGRFNQPVGLPVAPQPTTTASPARTPGNQTQGVLIDTDSNLTRGIAAEMMQEYKEAIKWLTRAIEDEHEEVIKRALAR